MSATPVGICMLPTETWSIGVIAYLLLSGKHPFTGKTVEQVDGGDQGAGGLTIVAGHFEEFPGLIVECRVVKSSQRNLESPMNPFSKLSVKSRGSLLFP